MRIAFSAAAEPYALRPLLLRNPSQSLLISCDGTGSWGWGVEAAAYALPRLATLWERDSSIDAAEIQRDLISVGEEAERRFNDEKNDGAEFSGLVALIDGDAVQIVHAGWYEAALLRSDREVARTRSTSVADKFIAEGKWPAEGLSTDHPTYFMSAGPFLGDPDSVEPIIEPAWALLPGDLLAALPRHAWIRLGAPAVWEIANAEPLDPALALLKLGEEREAGLSACAVLRFEAGP